MGIVGRKYELISKIIVIIPYIALSVAPQLRNNPRIKRNVYLALIALFTIIYAVLSICSGSVFRYRLLDFLVFGMFLSTPTFIFTRSYSGIRAAYGSYIGINSTLFLKLAACELYTETLSFVLWLSFSASLTIFIGCLFLHRLSLPKRMAYNTSSIRHIWMPLAVHSLTLCLASLGDDNALVSLLIGGFSLTGTYAAYWINEDIASATAGAAQIIGENNKLEQLLKIQESQYTALSGYMREIRAARHDLRHHYSAIKKYISDGDMDALLDYLETIDGGASEDYSMTICANPVVDAVARHYIGLAMQAGVTVDVALDISEGIGVAPSDLCIIIGNCLENAAEATCRMKSGNRFIRVRSECSASKLTIVVGNSYDAKLIETDGVYRSTKSPDRDGVGLSSIRAITEKYDGYADFKADDGVFITSVILFLKDDI